jgi:hypothetical protein
LTTTDLGVTQLEARLDGIAHVLRDRRLSVPKYQRSYAWGSEQVETFWSDLRSAMLSATPSYFLGTIVLSAEDDSRANIVIDGQQRLATVAILLAAIRDEFRDAGDEDRAQALQSQFLTYRDLKKGGETTRLLMNSSDAAFYSSFIIGGQRSIEPTGSSARRLQQAYDLLRRQVDQEAKAAKNNWQERLIRWAEFLEYEVRTIVVDVPSSADAFLIFETLNDRGLALTVADLLKNYLYGISGSKIKTVEAAWESTGAILESPDDEQRLLDFLRQYWSSWYGAVRERDLYRSFRMGVRSDAQAVELATKLAEASPNFLALATGDSSLWPKQAITQGEADTLQLLQVTQNRPLLLAAMEHFSPAELQRLTRATVSWLVRGIVAGGIGGGTSEKYFCNAAVKIREGRVRTADRVLEILGDVVPTDEQFRAAAATANAPRMQLTRYLLLAFERHERGEKLPGIVTHDMFANCRVQRILPRGATDWPGFVGEDVVGWSKKLGNYTFSFSEERHNSSCGTGGNQYDTSREAWSPRAIEARQSAFANAAPRIWPREP